MTITITRTAETASSTVDTAGARDYDLTIRASGMLTAIRAEATLVPRSYDQRLDMWGEMDHWLSGAASEYVRTLRADHRGEVLHAIVEACRYGEPVEVELD